MKNRQVWVLGFTVFGYHWRGIKLFEIADSWSAIDNAPLDNMFAKRAKNLNEAIESEKLIGKLELKAV